jgi:hypothetical protein
MRLANEWTKLFDPEQGASASAAISVDVLAMENELFRSDRAETGLAVGRLEGNRIKRENAERNRKVWRDAARAFLLSKIKNGDDPSYDDAVREVQARDFGRHRRHKPYSLRTIRDAITGTKREARRLLASRRY